MWVEGVKPLVGMEIKVNKVLDVYHTASLALVRFALL